MKIAHAIVKITTRSSWTKNNDGTVTQHWEIYNEKNIKIADAFRGNYKKRLNLMHN